MRACRMSIVGNIFDIFYSTNRFSSASMQQSWIARLVYNVLQSGDQTFAYNSMYTRSCISNVIILDVSFNIIHFQLLSTIHLFCILFTRTCNHPIDGHVHIESSSTQLVCIASCLCCTIRIANTCTRSRHIRWSHLLHIRLYSVGKIACRQCTLSRTARLSNNTPINGRNAITSATSCRCRNFDDAVRLQYIGD